MSPKHGPEPTNSSSDEEESQANKRHMSRRDVLLAGAAAVPVAASLPAMLSIPGIASPAQAATSTGSQGATSTASVSSLANVFPASPPAQLTGRVVRPLDESYPKDRTDFDHVYNSFPLVIVFAQNTQDVVNAVTWARQHDVAIRCRSGRHQLLGQSNVTGGIVVDVSEMKTIQPPVGNTITVGPGLTQLEAVDKLGAMGFATTTGSEGTVGLSGASLGGGFGLLVRQLGMACDNILEAQVVVPSGADGAKVVTANTTTNPDLLFGLRGAGNANFGIVTRFTYRIAKVLQTPFLTAHWDGFAALRGGVFNAWQKLATTAPNKLGSIIDVLGTGVNVIAILPDGTEKQIRDIMKPVTSIGGPAVTVQNTTWPDVFHQIQGSDLLNDTPNWRFISQFITQPFPQKAVDIIADFMSFAPTSVTDYFCQLFGGAVKTPPVGGSAFTHRNALFYAEPGVGWTPDSTSTSQVAEAWAAQFNQQLTPFINGAYANVPNYMMEWETAYWNAATYQKLRQIKKKWDPTNVFNYEQSIPPAT